MFDTYLDYYIRKHLPTYLLIKVLRHVVIETVRELFDGTVWLY